MKLRCVIVDDEPLAIEVIDNYLDRVGQMEVVGRCANALEALEILRREPVDLLFLDIQMPKITGIDFIKTIQSPPKVIFTTAYRDYALDSYDLDAVDYLLKPIAFERFLKAISKVSKNMTNQVLPPSPTSQANEQPFMYLKAEKKMIKVNLNDILYIESLKDYVRVKTATKEVITHQKISYLEEKLPEDCFLRIHRSFMVAINKIESYSATTIEVPGKVLPIGRNYKTQVLESLNSSHQL